MIRKLRRDRDYEAAGALAEEIPYWGWLDDDRSCLTRGGELVTVARLTPSVQDGRTAEQLDRVLERWQRMLSALDPQTRLYLYLCRRPLHLSTSAGADGVPDVAQVKRRDFLSRRCQDIRVYCAWAHNPKLRQAGERRTPAWSMSYARDWIKRRRSPHESTYLSAAIDTAAQRFRHLVDGSRALVSDLTPIEILPATEASRVLSDLVNRPGTPWDGATGSGMNWRLAISELEAERRYLRLDGEPLILYSLLSPPGGCRANLLRDLYRIDATMTISLEWRPWPLDAARRKIRSAQRHYFSKRYSMAAHVQETQGTAAAMEDSAAAVESQRLGNALVELEADGVSYGELALSFSLHGELTEIDRLDGDIRRIFAAHDAKIIREGYGQLAVWFARLPAQPRGRQVRSVFLSAGAAACLAPIVGPPTGRPHSHHLDKPALTVLETQWQTPYYYDLFSGDVGHTLILGSTGSGKSFLLNFLLLQALQYNPRVLILDLGGSYRWLTQFLGGGYLEVAAENGGAAPATKLRPFGLPRGERTFQFLTSWVSRLLRLGGWTDTSAGPTEIRKRIEDLYAFPGPRRTLTTLVHSLPHAMWAPMSRWHGDGAWGRIFDNPPGEQLVLADWQVIDLAGAAEHEDFCEAALFYLLECLRLALDDPAEATRVKLMVVDEAWRYLRDPAVLTYLAEAAKTWRKRNAALIMATQSISDITATPGADALLESMPSRLFLANPDLPPKAAEIFRLSAAEMDQIRELIPKREMYLRRPTSAAVVRLEVDPESYWLYTSSPHDAARRAAAVRKYGLTEALKRLARERSL